ncbi:MAG: cobalamin biosynthesis protein CbiA [Candidatus Zixiibacteriota bacterium]|nr:MAG: cobalamin biosynthesis protein CbiA [candidate division Zixibacteria bacterium]
MPRFKPPEIPRDIIIIVGGYGSGKSEVAVNLVRFLVEQRPESKQPISIVDLDIVNPYFRSREASEELERIGIRAIHPRGGERYADLPIILPDIKAGIVQNSGTMVLDVGGDDVGARVLSSLADSFSEVDYDLLFVLNANRPFTADVEGCLKMMGEIENACGLKFTGIISNTHLLEHTSEDTVLTGLKLAREVGRQTGLPVAFVSALAEVLDGIDGEKIKVPVLPLSRSLLKPWEKKSRHGNTK